MAQAVSNLVYQPVTDGLDALHDRIFDAVVARVGLLNQTAQGLRGVYVRRKPVLTGCEMPCLLLTAFAKSESELGGTNQRDDTGYPVYCLYVDREPLNHGEVPGGQTRRLYKLWRQQLRRAFREQSLPGVAEVMTVRVEPDPVVTLDGEGYSLATSPLLLRFVCREPRGLGA